MDRMSLGGERSTDETKISSSCTTFLMPCCLSARHLSVKNHLQMLKLKRGAGINLSVFVLKSPSWPCLYLYLPTVLCSLCKCSHSSSVFLSFKIFRLDLRFHSAVVYFYWPASLLLTEMSVFVFLRDVSKLQHSMHLHKYNQPNWPTSFFITFFNFPSTKKCYLRESGESRRLCSNNFFFFSYRLSPSSPPSAPPKGRYVYVRLHKFSAIPGTFLKWGPVQTQRLRFEQSLLLSLSPGSVGEGWGRRGHKICKDSGRGLNRSLHTGEIVGAGEKGQEGGVYKSLSP